MKPKYIRQPFWSSNPEKGVESTPYSFSLTERKKNGNPEKGVERERVPEGIRPVLLNPEKGVERSSMQIASISREILESRKGS